MATYVVTASPDVKWDDAHNYKNRRNSTDGSTCAQDEFDRRRAAGLEVYLWRWDNQPTLVESHGASVDISLPSTPEDISGRLFSYLRQMDAEATSLTDSGNTTGISDYGRHARQDLTRPQNEVEWSKRLAELLIADGVPTETEVAYPVHQRKRRDLRLQLDGGQSLTIEVKGAWSDYWGRRNKIYRSYLLHPLLPDLDATKTHTVPFDLLKLSTLRSPETDFVGQLLIGFESPDDPMDEDVELLKNLANLSEWTESTDTWVSPTVPGQRVRCWFWHRVADGGWTVPVGLRSKGSDVVDPDEE